MNSAQKSIRFLTALLFLSYQLIPIPQSFAADLTTSVMQNTPTVPAVQSNATVPASQDSVPNPNLAPSPLSLALTTPNPTQPGDLVSPDGSIVVRPAFVGTKKVLEVRDNTASGSPVRFTYDTPFLLGASGMSLYKFSPDNRELIVGDKAAMVYAFRMDSKQPVRGFQIPGLDPAFLSGMTPPRQQYTNYNIADLMFLDNNHMSVTLANSQVISLFVNDTDLRYTSPAEAAVMANAAMTLNQVSQIPVQTAQANDSKTQILNQNAQSVTFSYAIHENSTGSDQTGVNLVLSRPFKMSEVGDNLRFMVQGNADQIRVQITGTRFNSSFMAIAGIYLSDILDSTGTGAVISSAKLQALGIDTSKDITQIQILAGNAHAGGGKLEAVGLVTLIYGPHSNAIPGDLVSADGSIIVRPAFVGTKKVLEVRDNSQAGAPVRFTYDTPFLLGAAGINSYKFSPDNRELVVGDKAAMVYAFRMDTKQAVRGFQIPGLDPAFLSGMTPPRQQYTNYNISSMTFSDYTHLSATLVNGQVISLAVSDTDLRYDAPAEAAVLASAPMALSQVSQIPVQMAQANDSKTTILSQNAQGVTFTYGIHENSTGSDQSGVNLVLSRPFKMSEMGNVIKLMVAGITDQIRVQITGTRLNSSFAAIAGIYLSDILVSPGYGAVISTAKLRALGIDTDKDITQIQILVGNAHAGGGKLEASGTVTINYGQIIPDIVGTAYNQAAITTMPNLPTLGTAVGNVDLNSTISLNQTSARDFSVTYSAPDAGDFVFATIAGVPNVNLTGNLVFAATIAAGKKVKLEVGDGFNNSVIYYLVGTGAKQNYSVRVVGDNLSNFQPYRVVFVMENPNAGTSGTIAIETKGLDYIPPVNGVAYNQGLLSMLPGNPILSGAKGPDPNNNASFSFSQTSTHNFSMTYNLPDSSDFGFITLNSSSVNLSNGIVLAATIPAGKKMKIEFKDTFGKIQDYYLIGTGVKQNYGFALIPGEDAQPGFNRTLITTIAFVVEQRNTGTSGTIAVETKGMKYTTHSETYYPDGKLKSTTDTIYLNDVKYQILYSDYDTAGVKTRYLIQNYYPDGVTRATYDDYRYVNKILSAFYHYQWDTAGKYTNIYTNLYYPDGLIKSFDSTVSVNGVRSSRTYLLYNTSSSITQKIYQTYFADGITLQSLDDYRYVSNVLNILYHYQWDSAGKYTNTYTNLYYSDGRLKSSDSTIYFNGLKSSRAYVLYNTSSSMTQKIYQTYFADGVTLMMNDDFRFVNNIMSARTTTYYNQDKTIRISSAIDYAYQVLSSDGRYSISAGNGSYSQPPAPAYTTTNIYIFDKNTAGVKLELNTQTGSAGSITGASYDAVKKAFKVTYANGSVRYFDPVTGQEV